jgi:hypothetical protein
MYIDNPHIFPIRISTKDLLYKQYENINILYIQKENIHSLKVGPFPYLFFQTYYEQYHLKYSLRYLYEKINRNTYQEDKMYESIIIKKLPYIVTDHMFYITSFKHTIISLLQYKIKDIFNYSKIFENAEEIHLTYSVFFHLCMFLDLSKVNHKYIYTNITNIKEIHKNIWDWTIYYI